jgi:hypothetical protein
VVEEATKFSSHLSVKLLLNMTESSKASFNIWDKNLGQNLGETDRQMEGQTDRHYQIKSCSATKKYLHYCTMYKDGTSSPLMLRNLLLLL